MPTSGLKLFKEKLLKIHEAVYQAYEESSGFTSPVVGAEREIVVSRLLERILPSGYRIGSGEVIDADGNASGQVDVVIETPFSVSFPIVSDRNRLFLAEGVGALIEVKSNFSSQLGEIRKKVQTLSRLRRANYDADRLPIYVVAFKGPAKSDTLNEQMRESCLTGNIDGLLIIDPPFFFGRGKDDDTYIAGSQSGCIFAFIASVLETLKRHNSDEVVLGSYINMFDK